jgi:uncharacterized protein (DUF433 family)
VTFDRITAEPDKLEGKPYIRSLRISVETVVRLVAAGWSFDEILDEYPDLERGDITQALEYAAAATSTCTACTSWREIPRRRELRTEGARRSAERGNQGHSGAVPACQCWEWLGQAPSLGLATAFRGTRQP